MQVPRRALFLWTQPQTSRAGRAAPEPSRKGPSRAGVGVGPVTSGLPSTWREDLGWDSGDFITWACSSPLWPRDVSVNDNNRATRNSWTIGFNFKIRRQGGLQVLKRYIRGKNHKAPCLVFSSVFFFVRAGEASRRECRAGAPQRHLSEPSILLG